MNKERLNTIIQYMKDNELPDFNYNDANHCVIPIAESFYGTEPLEDMLEITSGQVRYLFHPNNWFPYDNRPGIPLTSTKEDVIKHLERFVESDGLIQ